MSNVLKNLQAFEVKIILKLAKRKTFRFYDLFIILGLSFFINKISDFKTITESPNYFLLLLRYALFFSMIVSFYSIYHLYIEKYDDARADLMNKNPFTVRYDGNLNDNIKSFIILYRFFYGFSLTLLITIFVP